MVKINFIISFQVYQFVVLSVTLATNVWGFVQWPIRDSGSRAAKSRFWVKVLFFDQISKRTCQSDMSLGFILSMRIYSDGHCTKQPCKSDSLSRLDFDVVQYFNIGH